MLDGCDGVGSCDPAPRRVLLDGERDEGGGELGGVAGLVAVHAVPGGDGVGGALGVVVDRGLGVGRGLRCEQLGAEEAGLDEHRVDAERRDLGGQRLDPALDPELGGGVGGAERLAHDAGGRGDGDDEPGALGAHGGEHGAGDVHRAEQGGLDLRPDVCGAELLEEPGVEVAGVVDHHVDAAEPVEGRLDGGFGGGGVGDVERDGQQVLVLAQGGGDAVGVAGGGDHGVAGGERGLGDVDAHAAAGAGDEPNVLVGHASTQPAFRPPWETQREGYSQGPPATRKRP